MNARRRRTWFDSGLFVCAVALVLIAGVAARRPDRPMLTVWSCGGNYDSLVEFASRFEARYDCSVSYTAAPVQYLLELALREEVGADVLVGRAGPGWVALGQEGKLARGPEFFALDPFVIVVPKGNPANVKGVEDLGREGVRIAFSPWAMRPKGKCPSHLLYMAGKRFHPGLEERWENNATAIVKCGRALCPAVADGRADAALVFRSLTTAPEVRGRLEIIPVPPKYVLGMKSCKATVPQCAAVLNRGRQPKLARQFVAELKGELGSEVLPGHGYLPVTSPEAAPYAPILEAFIPNPMPPWQVLLGDRLLEDGLLRNAARRYLQVIHVFGPTEFDAQCRYQAGVCAQRQNMPRVAAEQWSRLTHEYPRPEPKEFASPFFRTVCPGPGIEPLAEADCVREAREALRKPGFTDRRRAFPAWQQQIPATAVRVREGDPGKNGTRNFALAEDLLSLEDYAFATRDYLKVLTLNYPSRYMAAASLKIGLCDHLRGNHRRAQEQWKQTVERFPGTEESRLAGETLSDAPRTTEWEKPACAVVPMPPWKPSYDIWPDRGMTYGMALFDHHLPLFGFKEMMKLLHNVYQPTKLKPQARYRAGVCALWHSNVGGAVLQWRLCQRDFPDSPWAQRAGGILGTLRDAEALTEVQRAEVERSLVAPLPPPLKPPKPPCRQRFNIAEELFRAGLFDAGQAVLEYQKALTVTRASGKYVEALVPAAEFKIGLCFEAMGRPEQARRHFEVVVKEHPESEWAIKAAGRLKP